MYIQLVYVAEMKKGKVGGGERGLQTPERGAVHVHRVLLCPSAAPLSKETHQKYHFSLI